VSIPIGTVPVPEVDLHRESDKLRWASRYLTVPRVLGVGRDGPLEWLHTAGLPDPPPFDKLVVCNGDACAPNTLIDEMATVPRRAGHLSAAPLPIRLG
jgi:aminoglycoside phosphotransferase